MFKKQTFNYKLKQVNETDLNITLIYETTSRVMQNIMNKLKTRMARVHPEHNIRDMKLLEQWKIPDNVKHIYTRLIQRAIAKDMTYIINLTKNDGVIITTWNIKDVFYIKKDEKEWNIIIKILALFVKR